MCPHHSKRKKYSYTQNRKDIGRTNGYLKKKRTTSDTKTAHKTLCWSSAFTLSHHWNNPVRGYPIFRSVVTQTLMLLQEFLKECRLYQQEASYWQRKQVKSVLGWQNQEQQHSQLCEEVAQNLWLQKIKNKCNEDYLESHIILHLATTEEYM